PGCKLAKRLPRTLGVSAPAMHLTDEISKSGPARIGGRGLAAFLKQTIGWKRKADVSGAERRKVCGRRADRWPGRYALGGRFGFFGRIARSRQDSDKEEPGGGQSSG
ncbi:MAG: hypothetical protein ACREXS_02520, partial [Gammaproteobacteria bacterium]